MNYLLLKILMNGDREDKGSNNNNNKSSKASLNSWKWKVIWLWINIVLPLSHSSCLRISIKISCWRRVAQWPHWLKIRHISHTLSWPLKLATWINSIMKCSSFSNHSSSCHLELYWENSSSSHCHRLKVRI